MANSYTSSATLIITKDDLCPDALSELLGIAPSRSWKRGDRKLFKGEGEFLYKWGGWKLFQPTEMDEKGIDEQLNFWASFISQRSNAMRGLAEDSFDIVLDCYISTQEQLTLSVGCQRMVCFGCAGVRIDINVFFNQTV
jgi:hypothetical protein